MQNAADEMDVLLGQHYVTPIALDAADPAVRPAALALKLINAKLASGRIIMAADAGGQDKQLHQYGLSLVKEAQASLLMLSASSETLPGAEPLPVQGETNEGYGPRIFNKDPASVVDFFYDTLNPTLNAGSAGGL